MFESGYYPPGAQYDSSAPYNEEKQKEVEVEVTVSVTLSKTLKVRLDDYIIEPDSYGGCQLDFSQCNLRKAVEDQYTLPQDAGKYISNYAYKAGYKGCIEADELSNWSVDDFEVVLE